MTLHAARERRATSPSARSSGPPEGRPPQTVPTYALALIALAPLLARCGGDPGAAHGGETATTRPAIKNGRLAPEIGSVVAVVNFSGGQCSGTLILTNLVLTAQHCIAETADDTFAVDCDTSEFVDPDRSSSVFVVAQPEITSNPDDYFNVSSIRLPPADDRSLCGHDVALLELERPLVGQDLPPLLPRVDLPPTVGEGYRAVGFGAVGPDEEGASGIRRLVEARTVLCVGAACGDSTVRDSEWVGSDGPCPGDSGGPALDDANRIVGVVSRGEDGCATAVYGAVASYDGWLREVALDAATRSGGPAPGWARGDSTDPKYQFPLGARCDEDAACPSGLCGEDARCTRECNDEGPCPGGYACDEASGLCRAEEPAELGESCSLAWRSRDTRSAAFAVALCLVLALALRRRRANSPSQISASVAARPDPLTPRGSAQPESAPEPAPP